VLHTIEQTVEDAAQPAALWFVEMGCPVVATQLREKVHFPSVGTATHVVEELPSRSIIPLIMTCSTIGNVSNAIHLLL
jgi:hypothetical protein